MQTTQYPDLFFCHLPWRFYYKYCKQNPIVADEDLSFNQTVKVFICSLWLCKSKYYFPPLNDPNSFGTPDYDANIFPEINYSIEHVFISMSTQEPNKLHHICELERTQLLTFSARSVQNTQLGDYFYRKP